VSSSQALVQNQQDVEKLKEDLGSRDRRIAELQREQTFKSQQLVSLEQHLAQLNALYNEQVIRVKSIESQSANDRLSSQVFLLYTIINT
jgi:hypothetical protein